ncbi:MAG: polysaccharide biosynthesis tyrosine autokinase, partial [Alteraurantiacibacter sp.]
IEGQVDQGIASNQVYDLLKTQIGVIESRSLAATVAEDLNLAERPDLLGEDVDENRPDNISDEQWLQAKQKMAVSMLQGSVSADAPNENWIIDIAYRSENPRLAAEVANAYLAAFVASDIQGSLANNEYAKDYLEEQIEETRERLQEAEEAANAYARENRIVIETSGGEGEEVSNTLTASQLGSINARVSEARAKRIEAEQRWRSIQGLPAGQLVEVQSNALLQGLISQRSARQSELDSLRQRYQDAHPEVQAVLSQIESLNQQINRVSGDIKSTARTEYRVAQNQENALQQELNSVTGTSLNEQESQVGYSVLEREAQALRLLLQSLLNRFNQVSTAANVDSGTINPLDQAIVPGSPYSPSLMRNLLFALIFGGALAAALAVLREALDDKIRSLSEVEQKIGLPMLGHTPYIEDVDLSAAEADRFSPLMEAYASIRSTIDFALPREMNVIQLTSTQAAEGKSTTSLILAEMFARMGRRTLLIDGDLRRPSIAKLMDVKRPKNGIVEVLQGTIDLQSAVLQGMHENLEILPVGEIPSNPAEVFASSRLQEFIAKYRQEYDLILFDSSPMLGLADAPILSRSVDATIFVLEANRVQFSQVRNAVKRLRSSGGQPLGVILTKFRALQAGQSYDYQYAYYQYGEGKASA